MPHNENTTTGDAPPRDIVDHLTGATVERLMRAHGRTIGAVANAMGISQRRVREVRSAGVQGLPHVMDWAEGITGTPHLSWADVAGLYLGHGARRALPSKREAHAATADRARRAVR